MKMYKQILYITIAIFMTMSCTEDFLDQQSPDKLTVDAYWTDASAAEKMLVSAYSELSYTTWEWGEYYFIPLNYKGDDISMLPGSSDWSYLARMGKYTYDSGSSVVANLWSKYYACLRYSNEVIANIATIPAESISDEERNHFLGEAYFLRALAHFTLNTNFTNIILIEEALDSKNIFKGDVTREAAWLSIEQDFTEATKLLPETWEASNIGRATKGAAFGFLGKSHLFQKEYADAIQAFDALAELTHTYSLTTDYEGMFNGTNENSEESLFEIQFTTQEGGGMEYSASQASFVAIGVVGGWNMFRPSDYLLSQYEKERTISNELDKRLLATICYDDPENKSSFDGELWSTYFSEGETPSPMFKKFVDGKAQIGDGVSGVNTPLLRYADILLMYAEAVNESAGSSVTILNKLNEVRNRAGLADFTATDVELLRQEIRHQRLLEFPCEGQRFQDLVRYGIDVKQTLTDNGHAYATNYETKCSYYPIPAKEVSQNSEVTPTAGY